jgi:hypothetical protein
MPGRASFVKGVPVGKKPKPDDNASPGLGTPEKAPTPMDERRQIIQEYANSLRELMTRLRKWMD